VLDSVRARRHPESGDAVLERELEWSALSPCVAMFGTPGRPAAPRHPLPHPPVVTEQLHLRPSLPQTVLAPRTVYAGGASSQSTAAWRRIKPVLGASGGNLRLPPAANVLPQLIVAMPQ